MNAQIGIHANTPSVRIQGLFALNREADIIGLSAVKVTRPATEGFADLVLNLFHLLAVLRDISAGL